MEQKRSLSRRHFLRLAAASAAGAGLAACGGAPQAGTGATEPTAAPAAAATEAPAAALPTTAPEVATAVATALPSKEQVTIRFITNDVGWREDRYRSLLPKFQEEFPWVKVEFTHTSGGEFEGQSIPTWAAAGTMPDVFYHRTITTAARARLGWIKSLQPYIDIDPERQKLLDDFWPVQVPQITHQNEYYVIPENISSIALKIRPDYFEEAGVTYPDKPWTYQDFYTVAKQLTKREDGKTTRWGFDPSWMLLSSGFAWLWLPAGIIDPEQNKAIIDHPENAKALNMLADMKFKEGIMPRSEDIPEGIDLFSSDMLAMATSGVWEVTSNRDQMGEKPWDIVWLPANPLYPDQNLSINYGAGYAMGRDTKSPEGAWTLIRYLSRPELQQLLIVQDNWALPGRKSVLQDWVNGVKNTGGGSPEHVTVWADALETGRSVPVTPAAIELQDQYPNLLGPVLTTGEKRAEEVLPQVQAELQKILDKYAA